MGKLAQINWGKVKESIFGKSSSQWQAEQDEWLQKMLDKIELRGRKSIEAERELKKRILEEDCEL